MGISIFPSTAAEFVSNNFVIDMNDTTNNTADTGGVKQAGPYGINLASGDTSFDIYFIDADGNSVGYSNSTSITASGTFDTVVILGVANDDIITFSYSGSINNADGEGDEPGAGAYLESISPSDLPSIDDTATVTGGNFASDVEITFESGATVLSAKNIVVNSSTELLVTRPDALVEDDAPYDLKAVNPGVTPPTGTDAHILTDGVTAGSDPTWVTTSPLNQTFPGESFSQTLEATDSDGTVVDYSVTAGTITPGLTLNSSTGVLSGTPTTGGVYVFTVTATDDGGNTTPKEFEHSVVFATGGTVVDDGGFRYHTFTSSDDFEILTSISTLEVIAIGGGGGGGEETQERGAGGGGAGGLLPKTLTSVGAQTLTITVGAGGAKETNGSDSSLGALAVATGGGAGRDGDGLDGGSGGGCGTTGDIGGAANPNNISGLLGNDGGDGSGQFSMGGGGGAGEAGETGGSEAKGGNGVDTYSTWATATGLDFDGGYFAGGGGGGTNFEQATNPGGLGGGGRGAKQGTSSEPGEANSGGGGGGGGRRDVFEPFFNFPGQPGGSGLVIVRYAF